MAEAARADRERGIGQGSGEGGAAAGATGKIRGWAGFTEAGEGIDHGIFLSARGRIRAILIGVDFPDARADTASGPDAEVATYHEWLAPGGARWFERSSGGRLMLTTDFCPRWFRMSGSHQAYGFQRGISTETHQAYIQEAVDLAAGEVDLGAYDLVYIVVPRSASGITFSPTWVDHGRHVVAEGRVVRHAVTFGQDMWRWGFKVLNHETGHTLGLPDLYHYRPVGDPPNAHQSVGGWDLMGLISGHAPEPLAWHKWRLGWLDDREVAVVAPGRQADMRLAPVEATEGLRLVVLPLGPSEAVMAECRRRIGNDGEAQDEGLLVYRVDAQVARGHGPSVRILRRGREGGFAPDDLVDACFRAGGDGPATCAVDVADGEERIEVTVLEHGRSGDLVRVRRS